MKRRGFVIAGSAALFSAGLGWWAEAKRGHATSGQPGLSPHEGQLVDDPKGILDLRAGFTYRVLQRGGSPMSDGYRVPGRPDAMGCFDLGDGKWALMRNHELGRAAGSMSAFHKQRVPKEAYDAKSHGGVSRVVLDQQGKVLSSNLVLAGTSRNCAGGMSPWGWLSCEESVEDKHGFVFLCPIEADKLRAPKRIEAYGRFLHEAVAIDPEDHTAYLTEDRGDGCLYRYVPRDPAQPFGAGQLQAMAIQGRDRFRLGDDLPAHTQLHVHWVDVPAKEGERDNLRYAAQERGAAIVTRGEGIWRLSDGFAFTSTTGGPIAAGQIFHLAPTEKGGVLRLIAQANDQRVMDMPDNLTLTPWGDLLVCEDNNRAPFLRLVTQRGRVLPFAFNRATKSEFAGVCFSPDGNLLFVNIQEQNLTVAIEGPWASLHGA